MGQRFHHRELSSCGDRGAACHPQPQHLGTGIAAGAELAGHADIDRAKPAPGAPGGFTVDDFTVDHAVGTATCPNGRTRTITRSGWAVFGRAYSGCRLRARCTRSRRGKSPQIGRHDARQRAARRAARDPD